MTKGELRKQRQAEHAAKESARLASGDTRNARERQSDAIVEQAKAQRKAKRRAKSSRRPVWGSAEWAETHGDDIPSYDVPGDDFDMP